MKRKQLVGRETKTRARRSAKGLTDRRSFLTGAGKYGALLVGASHVPVTSAAAAPRQQAAADGDSMPVAEGPRQNPGAVQRGPGKPKSRPASPTPYIVRSYYPRYQERLRAPGRNRGSVLNVVSDAAFGGDGDVPPVSTNLHIQQTLQQLPAPCS